MNAQTEITREQFAMLEARLTRLEAQVEEQRKQQKEFEERRADAILAYHRKNKPTPPPVVPQIPKITILPSTRKGECGLRDGWIYVPLFRMGCCGDDRAVLTFVRFELPDEMNKGFFRCVAEFLKKKPYLDWHWASFKKNVIVPNREHIKQVMGLNEFFINRVVNDLHVVLNNWNAPEGLEEVGDEDEEYIPVSHETFFTHEDLDY